MNRYSYSCDAAFEMAVSRFAPVATIENTLENKGFFVDEDDRCTCGGRNWRHCPEHVL